MVRLIEQPLHIVASWSPLSSRKWELADWAQGPGAEDFAAASYCKLIDRDDGNGVAVIVLYSWITGGRIVIGQGCRADPEQPLSLLNVFDRPELVAVIRERVEAAMAAGERQLQSL